MRIEESRLLPVAEKVLTAADRAELDAAFARDPDPLASDDREGIYERLFSRIVTTAPDPVGLGRHLA